MTERSQAEFFDLLQRSHARHDAQEKRLMLVEDDVMEIKGAFPADDLSGHRRYHELQIRRIEEVRRLRIAIQEKTISGLIWVAILWAGRVLWSGGIDVVARALKGS